MKKSPSPIKQKSAEDIQKEKDASILTSILSVDMQIEESQLIAARQYVLDEQARNVEYSDCITQCELQHFTGTINDRAIELELKKKKICVENNCRNNRFKKKSSHDPPSQVHPYSNDKCYPRLCLQNGGTPGFSGDKTKCYCDI